MHKIGYKTGFTNKNQGHSKAAIDNFTTNVNTHKEK